MDTFIFQTPPNPNNYGLKKHISNDKYLLFKFFSYVFMLFCYTWCFPFPITGTLFILYFDCSKISMGIWAFSHLVLLFLAIKLGDFCDNASKYLKDYDKWVISYKNAYDEHVEAQTLKIEKSEQKTQDLQYKTEINKEREKQLYFEQRKRQLARLNEKLRKADLKREEQLRNRSKIKEYWIKNTGRKFEEKIAKLFTYHKFRVVLTPASNDGGIDVIAHKGDHTIAIQCKCHKNPTGIKDARELYGILCDRRAEFTGGILVNPAGFTAGVYEFIKNKPIRLFDIEHLLYWSQVRPE